MMGGLYKGYDLVPAAVVRRDKIARVLTSPVRLRSNLRLTYQRYSAEGLVAYSAPLQRLIFHSRLQ